MRMWLGVDPAEMCRKHLLGEHVEIHMLMGSILKGKSIKGFLDKGLVDPEQMWARHDALVHEIVQRGYDHGSPLMIKCYDKVVAMGLSLEKAAAACVTNRIDLAARCPECAARMGVNHNPHQEALPANPGHVLTQESIDLQRRADLAWAEFLRGTEGGQQ